MLNNLPIPQPDQTLESYVSALQLSQAAPDRRSFINALFGGRSIEPGKFVCSSIGRLFDTLGNSHFSSPREIIEHHSLSALFQPFLPQELWQTALHKQVHGPLNGLFTMLGTTYIRIHKPDTHYCPGCIQRDLATAGYAYTHRCHQIIGLTHCPEHNQQLLPLSKQAREQYHQDGLLLVERYEQDLLAPPPEYSGATPPYQKALGQWVQRVYKRRIPQVSITTRLRLIKNRLISMPRRPHVPPASALQLEEVLVDRYGKMFLNDIGLSLDSGPTSHWPALLLWNVSYIHHPLTNLVILAALFPNPDTYIELTQGLDDTSSEYSATSHLKHHRIFCLSTSLIRDLLRESSLKTIAASHNTTEDVLREFLASANYLQERRNAALRRRAAQNHRRRIIQTIAAHPELLRSELYRRCKGPLDWAYRNDSEWLERQLPASRTKRVEYSRTQAN